MKIDDTIKEYFRQGVKLFYDTCEARTLKETFERTIVHFFHQGWKWCNGVMVPILPPTEELPTLAQFRYWYGREQGLQ
jgi:putative transposase